jgi:Zn-dependent protease with chaperone function
MMLLSYLVLLCIAAASAYLPYLVVTNMHTLNAQVLVLFLSGLVIAGTILYSLVPRRDRFVPPGLLLEPSAHPKLFDEIHQLAADLNEPVPEEVYLIGAVNAWVADRGGILGFGSRRVMAIGLPLISILSVSEFRGVLAHEFAHYYGGDTKLGPFVYRTQSAVARALQNTARFGAGVSLPWLFRLVQRGEAQLLNWYFLLFLRAINFVSRKSEFRADELACIIAGSSAVTEGLRKIHGAGSAWLSYWASEVSPLVIRGHIPPIAAGFAQFLAAPTVAPKIAQYLEKELAGGESDPYDSHPPLRQRLAAVSGNEISLIGGEDQSAVCLLPELEQLELRWLEFISPERKTGFHAVAWSESASVAIIPSWRSALAENPSLFEGLRIEAVPYALRDLPEISRKFHDPKGMLLRPEQRIEHVAQLLPIAVGLTLLDHGWQLEANPGLLYFHKDGQKLNVFEILGQLRGGSFPHEQWLGLSHRLGIADLMINAAETKPSFKEPKSRPDR